MKKEELEKHFDILRKILEDFIEKEQHHIHGKSSKIRKRALTYMESYLKRFERYVGENDELLKLLTSGDGAEDAIEISWDELNSIHYFGRVMPIALKKLESALGEVN